MSIYRKAYITNFWSHCHLVCLQDQHDMTLNHHGNYECPECHNSITVYDVEKVIDKLMKQIINDDLEDIIMNYTGFVIKTTKDRYKVIKHKDEDFWIAIPPTKV